ncbi:MAG: homocysteine S-methyltransferase family protein [Pseudomonadota bacterium]
MILQRDPLRAKPVILDGGVGSEIRARGHLLHSSAWSALAHVEDPALVMGIHHDYLAAGAEIVTANTFPLSRHNLEHAGLGASFASSNKCAVELAKSAVRSFPDRQAFVAGSMSTIPPMDSADHLQTGASAFRNYCEQAEILAESGVDLIIAEMLLEIESASLLLEAASTVELPLWAGLSAMLGDDHEVMGFRTPGKYLEVPSTRFSELIEAASSFSVELIAVMHTKIDVVPHALDVLEHNWRGPIAAYAETGKAGDSDWFFDTAAEPDDYADCAVAWFERFGLDAVGGCCGTRPAHIAALSQRLR